MTMKKCKKCGILKDYTEFNKLKYAKDGLQSRCRLCTSEYMKGYSARAREHRIQYYWTNRPVLVAYQKKYREETRDKKRAYMKKWRAEHAAERTLYRRKYQQIKRKTDPAFKLAHAIRNRIRKVFIGTSKSKSTLAILGCSIDTAKFVIESQFQPGMRWDNYGQWHVDHILPLGSVKGNIAELEKRCNIRNLQPLWAEDNIKKGMR